MEKNRESLNYKLWQNYRNNTDVQSFLKNVEIAQKFYNGEQYNTPAMKNEPRVVMNIVSFSSNIKASKIVGTPMYIKYTSDNENVSCIKLERFDEYNQSKLKAKSEAFQSALNGYNDSIDISLIRWDTNDTTYKGIFKGGLVYEHIRPKDFAVANISLSEIQNQKWIMYRSFEELGYIKKLCEDKEKAKLLKPDDYRDGEVADTDAINHRTVELFTRFFRIDGEVFFMCSTRTTDLFKYPKALNPRLSSKIAKRIKISEPEKPTDDEIIKDYDGIDYEDAMIPFLDDSKWEDKDYIYEKEKFSLYPVAIFVPFVVNGKFYGRSDARTLVPIQQGINFGINMMLKCAQNNAYNKIFAKEGALQGQTITNEPGEIIVDHTKMTNGWGIKMAETQPMPNGLINFIEKLLSMTRVIYSFNDVMDGSISNQDVSGYAIQQMIKQSNTSIEQQQQIFWQFQTDLAAIRLMYYKFYVDKAKFTYEMSDAELSKEGQALIDLKELQKKKGELAIGKMELPEKVNKIVLQEIDNDEIYGNNFDINIEVEQGLVDSKLAESQVWDTLIMNGGIQNMTPEMLEMYLEGNPVITPRTKQSLKAIIEKQKAEENTMLKQQNAEYEAKLKQAVSLVNQLTNQNKGLGTFNQNLQKEFTEKINAQNKTIEAQNLRLSELLGKGEGISEGEIKSNNSLGIAGTTQK